MEKVLLIAPPSSSYLGAARPPSGLGYLSQALQDAGIDHKVLDFRNSRHLNILWQTLQTFQPDIVGISIVSFEYAKTYALAGEIKRQFPKVRIVVGGPHVSALGDKVLQQCPEIDYGIQHEGELPLVQLASGIKPLAEIPGLLYRENGNILSGPPALLRADIDDVRFPRYEKFDLSQYVKEIPLITSRGCPYQCIFCPNSLTMKRFRARSANNVVDELEYWYKRGIRQFNIDDDNFSLDKKRVYAICDEIQRRRMQGLFIRCANGLRADRVDKPLLIRMKEIGIREVAFGADGGNDRVLMEVVHKGEHLADIERAVQDSLSIGLKVKVFIIVGSPGETESDIEDSLALAQRYPITYVQLNNPIPYPGTELYRWVEEHNHFLMPPEVYLNQVHEKLNVPVFETPELPMKVREKYLVRCQEIERQVLRKAVERMFHSLPGFRRLAGWLFVSDLGQWMFFRNIQARAIINRIWYRKAVKG